MNPFIYIYKNIISEHAPINRYIKKHVNEYYLINYLYKQRVSE
jgi:hypothetical protein